MYSQSKFLEDRKRPSYPLTVLCLYPFIDLLKGAKKITQKPPLQVLCTFQLRTMDNEPEAQATHLGRLGKRQTL